MDRIEGKIEEYETSVCLRSIIVEWRKVKREFYATGENALQARIFKNNGFLTVQNEYVEEVVFGRQRGREIQERCRDVMVENLVTGRGCISKDNSVIVLRTRLNISN